MLKSLIGGAIREEMKRRVDEVLKAGSDWNSTATALNESLKQLVATINQGKVEPATLKSLGAPLRALGKKTDRLAKAFTSYEKTLKETAAQFQ